MAVIGRPLKWKSIEELQSQIDNYFNNTPENEWTVSGLAIALDTTYETLNDYENGNQINVDGELRKDFSSAIKKAKLKVHNAYEKDMRHKGGVHNIFALKNFGWKDKQEIDAKINNADITDEQVEALLMRRREEEEE
jgi:hypothetical protein